jgi:hypothetical protein
MRTSELAGPFNFTKEMPVLRIDALKDARRIPNNDRVGWAVDHGTVVYDLERDPKQLEPFRDEAVERRLRRGIEAVLRAHDAPAELYARYQLRAPSAAAPTPPGPHAGNPPG